MPARTITRPRQEQPARRIFRTNFRNRRLMLGLTQEDLAATLGVSQQYIWIIENKSSGKTIPFTRFDDVCRALKTTLAMLFTEDAFPPPREHAMAGRRPSLD